MTPQEELLAILRALALHLSWIKVFLALLLLVALVAVARTF